MRREHVFVDGVTRYIFIVHVPDFSCLYIEDTVMLGSLSSTMRQSQLWEFDRFTECVPCNGCFPEGTPRSHTWCKYRWISFFRVHSGAWPVSDFSKVSLANRLCISNLSLFYVRSNEVDGGVVSTSQTCRPPFLRRLRSCDMFTAAVTCRHSLFSATIFGDVGALIYTI